MTQKHFADRIALTRADTNLWTGDADRYFGNGVERQFGGWVGAAMLKAVMADAKPDHHPRALITHFLSGVTHAPITIRTKPMREGRSVSYWQAEMIQNDAVCAHAVITLGELREDAQAHTGSSMPVAVGPDAPGLMRFKPLAPFADELEQQVLFVPEVFVDRGKTHPAICGDRPHIHVMEVFLRKGL